MERRKCEAEFFGYPSGDYESFCFDVPRKTYIALTGRKPEKYDKSHFNKKTYRVYLQDLINMPEGKQCIFKLNMEVEPLESPITI